MPPIQTHEPVFLGVVVNPKTHQPIYVVREGGTNLTVQIWWRRPRYSGGSSYWEYGSGYLNDSKEYAGPTDVTGLPRSHTPSGVVDKGGGFGTTLYTGLVLLATAHSHGEIAVRGVIGRGMGISSEENTRSTAASAWWEAANRRGLAKQDEGTTGEPEEETEELNEERISDYVSSRAWRQIESAITDAVDQTEWRVTGGVTVTADIARTVESDSGSEDITADYYTYESATTHKLVAVRQTSRGGMWSWAGMSVKDGGHVDTFKEVILALDVAGEDLRLVGKLALIAQAAGASEVDITNMMVRHRFGVDLVSRRREVVFEAFDEPAPVASSPPKSTRRRVPPPYEKGRPRPQAPVPNPADRIVRRNPGPPTANDQKQIDRALDDLERRRDDLGWNKLEDLP
jgi:hypothetical protein